MIRNIAIVSLSSGIIGEPFVQFEVEIGLRRLKEYGLNIKFIRKMNKMHPRFFIKLLLPGFHLIDHLCTFLRCKGLQRI